MHSPWPALAIPFAEKLAGLLRDWGEDARTFLRHEVPKILLVLLVSLLLIRGLRLIITQLLALQVRKLPPGVRVVPGIDRVGSGQTECLMLVRTRPNQQYGVSRELQRRMQAVFEKNQVQTAGPGRAYVIDPGDTPPA